MQEAVKAFPLFLLYAAARSAAVVLRWILAFPKIQISRRNTLWRTITPSLSTRRPNGENIKTIHPASVDRDTLVDIRDVQVNTALPAKERALDFIRQIGNPYCYKHGKYVVKVGFSDTETSLMQRLAGYIASKA